MKESNIQTLFGKWLKQNNADNSYAFELKLCKGKSIPLDAVKEHQVQGLLQAKKGQYIKLQDMSAVNGFANPKPWDCCWLKAKEAYVAILFYKLRQPKNLRMITVEKWLELCQTHPRKSIREEDIINISNSIRI